MNDVTKLDGCGECAHVKWNGQYAVNGGHCRLNPPPYVPVTQNDWCSHWCEPPEEEVGGERDDD